MITIFLILDLGFWAMLHLSIPIFGGKDDCQSTLFPIGIFLLPIMWMGYYAFAKNLLS